MQALHVLIETTSGDILIELFEEKAPLTVANFLHYVDNGFYSNTIFHRVIKDFMIQGGGYTMRLEAKACQEPIHNEASNGLRNTAGTIAMARTADPHSATCQFFINTVDNPDLDYTESTDSAYGYCVFGTVVDGMDTVKKIEKTATRASGEHEHLPKDSVLITQVSRFII